MTERAQVIVVGNEKGGSGKSTTAMHLVVGLLRQGHTVASLDLDARQGTLSRYVENRKAHIARHGPHLQLPMHASVTPTGDDDADSQRLELAMDRLCRGSRFVIIDSPGNATPLARMAHGVADLILTPLNDSFVDLDVLGRVDGESLRVIRLSHYAELIWEARKQRAMRDGGSIDWLVMRNRLSSLAARNKQRMEKALEELSRRIGFRIISGLHERVIYRELFPRGLTLMDLRDAADAPGLTLSNVAARAEIRNLVDAVLSTLQARAKQ